MPYTGPNELTIRNLSAVQPVLGIDGMAKGPRMYTFSPAYNDSKRTTDIHSLGRTLCAKRPHAFDDYCTRNARSSREAQAVESCPGQHEHTWLRTIAEDQAHAVN